MNTYWENQVVLVTGGTGGMGQEIVRHFAGLGCKVAIGFLKNHEGAEQLTKSLGSSRVRSYQADVGDDQQVEQMVSRIEEELGPVTILINNAGLILNNLLITMSNEEWHSIINTHLTGTFYCTRRVIRNMIRAKHGRIINISSTSAVQGVAGQVHYSSAKAGAIAFARSLAQEVGTKGITCNAVVLGLCETENARENVTPELYKRIAENSPLRRVGQPREVVGALEYLASDKSGLMTGQVLTLG